MRIVLIPNYLQSDIEAAMKQAEEKDNITLDDESRAEIYNQLLSFFDENGYLPDFSLRKREIKTND